MDDPLTKKLIALLVLAVPFVAFPALFKVGKFTAGKFHGMAKGSSVGKGILGATDRAKQNLGARAANNKLGFDEEGNARGGRGNRVLRAAGRVGSFAGGYGYRRKRKHGAQDAFAEKAQLESYSRKTAAGGTPDGTYLERRAVRSGAGVAGEEGQLALQARATADLAKLQDEELTNAMTLLAAELRRSGKDSKTFSSDLGKYYEASTPDANGNVDQAAVASTLSTIGPTLGSFIQNKAGMKAALNFAASTGEVGTVEKARANNTVDQSMVNDVISRNDGTLKGKGGYHLATDFGLAAAEGEGGDSANQRIAQSRLNAFASSSAQDIAGMKFGVVESVAKSVEAGYRPVDRSGNIDAEALARLKQTIAQAKTSGVSGALSEKAAFLDRIERNI